MDVDFLYVGGAIDHANDGKADWCLIRRERRPEHSVSLGRCEIVETRRRRTDVLRNILCRKERRRGEFDLLKLLELFAFGESNSVAS